MSRSKRAPSPPTSISSRILAAVRAAAGAEASATACATALAAAAGVNVQTAGKVLRGGSIRPDKARKIATALAGMGCALPAGDIAMGDEG